MSGTRLNAAVLRSIEASVLCWLATVDEEGAPSVSPKEVFCADDDRAILIADIASAGSVANIGRNSAVCVSFIDVFEQRGFKVKGAARVLGADDAGFPALHAPLALRAGAAFPIRNVIEVLPTRIAPIVAPSYALMPDMSDADRRAGVYRTYGVRPT
ncbi:MAG: pyridoxamine 5'-phosphate oxidase family protein [Rubricella sp.]